MFPGPLLYSADGAQPEKKAVTRRVKIQEKRRYLDRILALMGLTSQVIIFIPGVWRIRG
jgi:hypothetical protein